MHTDPPTLADSFNEHAAIWYSASPEYLAEIKRLFPTQKSRRAFLKKFSPTMKIKSFKPTNQNILVRRVAKPSEEHVLDGGILVPAGTTTESVTEQVEIVAISPDLHMPNGDKPSAKAGNFALIHRGLPGTPVTVNGEELLVIGYVNLIGVVA